LESSYFLSRRSIFEAMPLREGAVIFAGDSLTEQCAWGELLQSPLVLGRGIGGEPIAGLRLRLAEVLRHRPRQMILLSGVNNLLQGADVESLALEHRALVEEVLQSQPHVQVVIQSLLPVSEANFAAQPTAASRRQREMNAAIVQVNQTLRDLYATLPAERVVYADIHSHLLDGSGQLDSACSLDGLHLTGQGYARWRDAVRPLLQI
jgi:lysophospholipase L1-like esterase